jgi:hypothetical protein
MTTSPLPAACAALVLLGGAFAAQATETLVMSPHDVVMRSTTELVVARSQGQDKPWQSLCFEHGREAIDLPVRLLDVGGAPVLDTLDVARSTGEVGGRVEQRVSLRYHAVLIDADGRREWRRVELSFAVDADAALAATGQARITPVDSPGSGVAWGDDEVFTLPLGIRRGGHCAIPSLRGGEPRTAPWTRRDGRSS